MTKKALQAAYDVWHGSLEAQEAPDAPWHRLVMRHLQPFPSGTQVLEIGCGRGELAVYLASLGPSRLVAADFSPVAVEKAKATAQGVGIKNIEFAVDDIESLSFNDGTFDTVVSCETVEHIPDPQLAVRELARVLKPGGRLFLTTPNYLSVTGLHRAFRVATGRPYTEGGQPHNNVTMLPRTRRWVRRAGLRVIAVDGTGHYLPIPRRTEGPLEVRLPSPLGRWLRRLGAHSLVVAAKPTALSIT